MEAEFFFSLMVAFFGGLLSFLSPCILPVVPGYLSFIAGVEFDDLAQGNRRVLPATLLFVAGFSSVFIAFGATASALHPLLLSHQEILRQVAGAFIVLLGLHISGVIPLGFLTREWRFHLPTKELGFVGAFAVGLAFGFGWTPCIGPILATILTLAATHDSLGAGVALLGVYALGIGLPFVASALGFSYFMRTSTAIKAHHKTIRLITAGLVIGTGILIYLGSLQIIASYLLDWFPFLINLG